MKLIFTPKGLQTPYILKKMSAHEYLTNKEKYDSVLSKEFKEKNVDEFELYIAETDPSCFGFERDSKYGLDILYNNPNFVKLIENEELCTCIMRTVDDHINIDKYLPNIKIIAVDDYPMLNHSHMSLCVHTENGKFHKRFIEGHYKENISEEVRFLSHQKYAEHLESIGYHGSDNYDYVCYLESN